MTLFVGHGSATHSPTAHLTDGRVVRAVAGFDATFSAPKSLSVLWALTQDPRLLAAHDAAVTAALGAFGAVRVDNPGAC